MEVDPVQLNLIYDPNPKCSNYGCTASRLDLDLSAECVFHPGKPVFHEGYKYWDCCKRKSLGFDDFLNQKGCTKGEHCWTPKPKPEPKETLPEDDESLNSSTTIAQPPVVTRPAMEFRKRPDPNEPLLAFEIEVSPSLEKQIQEGKLAAEEELPVKTCQNSGCSVKNSETESNPICYFHSGEAVFHEGLKYWSCCKKKAFEFEQFLKQKGCKEGEHRWLSEKKVDCRFDWHQTGSHVILAIYAKGYNPSSVTIKANAVRLQISCTLPSGVYTKDWILFGIIEESNCYSCLFPTKIEIKLKKAEPGYWTDIEHKESSTTK